MLMSLLKSQFSQKWNKKSCSLITWAEKQGVQWVNLNELEFSERNCDAFRSKGYQVKNDISAACQRKRADCIKDHKDGPKKES